MNTPRRDIIVALNDPTLRDAATTISAAAGGRTLTAKHPDDIPRLLHTTDHTTHALADLAHAHALKEAGFTGPLHILSADPHTPDYAAALTLHAYGAYQLPSDNEQLLNHLTHTATQHRNHGPILTIIGGSGGVGTSTTAALLARRAARHQPVALVDAHPAGSATDLLLGIENIDGARWQDIHNLTHTPDAATLLAALPTTHDNIAVLTHARTRTHSATDDPAAPSTLQAPDIVRELSHSTTPLITIVDAPATAALPTTHTLMVCAAEIRALVTARSTWKHTTHHHPNLSIALRHRGWSSTTKDEAETILDHPIAATITTHKSIAHAIELTGLPTQLPHGLARALDELLDTLLAAPHPSPHP